MKKIIAILTLTAFTIGAINAQSTANGTRTPEERANDRIQEIQKNISLEQTQTEKIKGILVEFFTKSDAVKASVDDGTLKSKLQQLKLENETAIKAILTPEQLKKAEEWEKNKNANTAKPRE